MLREQDPLLMLILKANLHKLEGLKSQAKTSDQRCNLERDLRVTRKIVEEIKTALEAERKTQKKTAR